MEKTQKKASDKYLVTQSNQLIEADYSGSKFSARTLKIGRLVFTKINPNDTELQGIRIKNSVIRECLGYKRTSVYNRFRDDLEFAVGQLNKRLIRFKSEEGDDMSASLISTMRFDRANDVTIFKIPPDLKPHLIQLKTEFTSYPYINLVHLQSSFSVRMYELLCQYRKIGKRKVSLSEIKKYLDCNYKLYGHFKSKALLKAQKELEKYTDLRFEFEEIKTGRKVTGLVLFIYPNDPQSNEIQRILPFFEDFDDVIENENDFPQEIIKKMLSIGIDISNIERMLKSKFEIVSNPERRADAEKRCKFLSTYYLEKLTLLAQSKTTNNPAGFFIKALKEDWRNPQQFQKTKINEAKKLKVRAKDKLTELKKQEEQLVNSHEAEKQEIFNTIIEENEKEFIEIYNAIEDNHPVLTYKKQGLSPHENYKKSVFLRVKINDILEKSHGNLFDRAKQSYKEIEGIRTEIDKIKKQWRL